MNLENPSENRCMSQDDEYILIFDPITNSNSKVRFINHAEGKDNVIGFTIHDEELRYRALTNYPEIIADLIDLAAAIYASDRLVPQDLRKNQRSITVKLPLRNPDSFNAEMFSEKLKQLLSWTTGSEWKFKFSKRTSRVRDAEQPVFPVTPKDCEVALWSGGLDALAGLYTRLKENSGKSFVLLGSGSNENVLARQKKVESRIQSLFPGRTNLYRIPIRFHESTMNPKNKVSRARGVVFTLLGSACAYLMGRSELFVYENGVGALNLPYRKSAVGLDHSRSVHPLTLLMVGELISDLLKEEFKVHNPFVFWTKSEMCKSLSEDGKVDLSSLTKSCDSPHRKRPSQCGYCSSCILRRHALIAANLEDTTEYVILHGKKPVVEDTTLYFKNMLEQASLLKRIFNESDDFKCQWQLLIQRFPGLDDIIDRSAAGVDLSRLEVKEKLLNLYKKHVSEWDAVSSQLELGCFIQSTDREFDREAVETSPVDAYKI